MQSILLMIDGTKTLKIEFSTTIEQVTVVVSRLMFFADYSYYVHNKRKSAIEA